MIIFIERDNKPVNPKNRQESLIIIPISYNLVLHKRLIDKIL